MEHSVEQKAASRQAALKRIASGSVSYLGLVVLIVLFGILTGGSFLSVDNLTTVAKQGFTIFITALAAVFVMATGNLDFSIGANVGFSCAVCAIVCKTVSPAAGVAAASPGAAANGDHAVVAGDEGRAVHPDPRWLAAG